MDSNSRNLSNKDISASSLAGRLDENEHLHLLDVRNELEYHTYNIGGVNIPLNVLPDAIEKLGWDKADEIIVICKAGLRSETAKSILQQNGYVNVRNLTGGLVALQKIK